MKPPTFFLSSTIYDFKDLRSAIKYFLEQQGCRVLASEYNDFSKPVDSHSYEACLQAIQQADWFVLLIGSRVGGWYDERARISITQQEYREAYKLHKGGSLKLLNFVRADVWRMKEDRKELTRHLDMLGYDPGAKEKIIAYPSKAANDAEFISAFISEIGRNKETQDALKTGTPLPTGNWIHIYNEFKDIIEPLQVHVFGGRPIEEVALRKLLGKELRGILLSTLMTNGRDKEAFSPRWAIDKFHRLHRIPKLFGEKYFTVQTDIFDQLCSMAIHCLMLKLHPQILPKAIESSTFMTFNAAEGLFVEEPVYEALLMLDQEIRLLTMVNANDIILKTIYNTSSKALPSRGTTIEVETVDLVTLLHLMDRWNNIIELSKAIVLHLEGKVFTMPLLRPRSPISYDSGPLEDEDVTEQQLRVFLSK